MRLVARVVVTELLRRGDLVRVAAEGGGDLAGTYCLLREPRRFVDISAIDGEPAGLPAPVAPDAPATTPVDPAPIHDVADLLQVLEDAGRLDVQDPQAGESGATVDGILALMSRYMPQVRLSALLHDGSAVPEGARHVFAADPREASAGWQAARSRGGAVWISNPSELPRRLREGDAEGSGALGGAEASPLPWPRRCPCTNRRPATNPGRRGRKPGCSS